MSFIGGKGREIYLTFQWGTMQVGSGESTQNVKENDILQGVVGKFKVHLEAKKNPIMVAAKFDRRRQTQGEMFDSFVTDLKLLARGLEMMRNAITCKSLDERVRQCCLEESKNLTLEMAIDISRMFEATKDGMQVMPGEELKVEVNKLAWKNGLSKKNGSSRNNNSSKKKNEKVQKCDRCGYNAHKPQENCPAGNESCNKCKKLDILPRCAEASKEVSTYMNEVDYSGEDSSSDEEGPDSDVQLLHVASLEVNGVSDTQEPSENDEWWEVVEVGNSSLYCQLDTGAYASVINNTQLKQVAPSAQIKQTKKTLEHRITPKGFVTLPVKFRDRELSVNFYVIDSKQKPILSGKVCQALNLVQRVHKLQAHVDPNLKELLDQYPDLQSASGAMPGTCSIKIDPKATPVVHGPCRQPAALLPKIIAKLRKWKRKDT